jgi:hypothetical protein
MSSTDKSKVSELIEGLFVTNSLSVIKHFNVIFEQTVAQLVEQPLQSRYPSKSVFFSVVETVENILPLLEAIGFKILPHEIEYESTDQSLLSFADEYLHQAIEKANNNSANKARLDSFIVDCEHFSATDNDSSQQLGASYYTQQSAEQFGECQKLLSESDTNKNPSAVKEVIDLTDCAPPLSPLPLKSVLEAEDKAASSLPLINVDPADEQKSSNNSNTTLEINDINIENKPSNPVDSNAMFNDVDSKIAKLVEFGFSPKQASYALRETKNNLDRATALLCTGGVADVNLPDVENSNKTSNTDKSDEKKSNDNHDKSPINLTNNDGNLNYPDKTSNKDTTINNDNKTQNNDSELNNNINNTSNNSPHSNGNSNSQSGNNDGAAVDSDAAVLNGNIGILKELGFSEEMSRSALQRYNNNLERATNFLFTGPTLNKQKSEDIGSVVARLDAEEAKAKETAKLEEELQSQYIMEKLKFQELQELEEKKNERAAQDIADSENVRNYLIRELHSGKLLSIQQHNYILAPSSHTAASQYECKVCYCEYSIDEIVILDVCRHYLCLTCMKQYVTTAINDGRSTDMKCPNTEPECKRIITHSEVQRIVDQKEFEKYQSFMLDSHLKLDPLARWLVNSHMK